MTTDTIDAPAANCNAESEEDPPYDRDNPDDRPRWWRALSPYTGTVIRRVYSKPSEPLPDRIDGEDVWWFRDTTGDTSVPLLTWWERPHPDVVQLGVADAGHRLIAVKLAPVGDSNPDAADRLARKLFGVFGSAGLDVRRDRYDRGWTIILWMDVESEPGPNATFTLRSAAGEPIAHVYLRTAGQLSARGLWCSMRIGADGGWEATEYQDYWSEQHCGFKQRSTFEQWIIRATEN